MFYKHLQNATANLQHLGYLGYLGSLLMGIRTQSIASRAAKVIGNCKSQHHSTTNVAHYALRITHYELRITHQVAGKFSRRISEI